MINKEYFKKLKKDVEDFDDKREDLITLTRKIVRLSKEIIYLVHRKDFSNAEKKAHEIESLMKAAKKEVGKNPQLDIGAYKVAVQEYVEAISYLKVMREDDLPSHESLGVDIEYYLLGICDLIGEMSRAAMSSAIKEDSEAVERIRNFVYEIFEEMMQIDFRNGELRKKVDGMRYEMQKLDNLAFQLKMKK